MKLFQILNGFCHYEMTNDFPDLAATVGKFSSDIIIVEAPDYVFPDWGYDATLEGDERFIKPIAPEGWLYDDATGTYYQEGTIPQSQMPTIDERMDITEDAIIDTDIMNATQNDRLTIIEDALIELANMIGGN